MLILLQGVKSHILCVNWFEISNHTWPWKCNFLQLWMYVSHKVLPVYVVDIQLYGSGTVDFSTEQNTVSISLTSITDTDRFVADKSCS